MTEITNNKQCPWKETILVQQKKEEHITETTTKSSESVRKKNESQSVRVYCNKKLESERSVLAKNSKLHLQDCQRCHSWPACNDSEKQHYLGNI
jgi:hypothetical protein